MSEIQAILFHKDKWTEKDAEKWLKDHDYHPIKAPHETEKYLRYRIHDPNEYKKMRIKHMGNIDIVFGFN